MKVQIVSHDEYILYLKKELSKHTENDKQLKVLMDNMYTTFQDGIKFNQGKLEVEVNEIV